MKAVMARRLRRVEEGLRRLRPIEGGYSASALLKQKLDQMADRLDSGGNTPPEPALLAEVQEGLARWRAGLADRSVV